MTHLLVVCLGNICRSPMGEGALKHHIQRQGLASAYSVDSAGTSPWHQGKPADKRAVSCAKSHGVDIAMVRSRQIDPMDFQRCEWILCADTSNYQDVCRQSPSELVHKVVLWLPWPNVDGPNDIPDPYTGGEAGFEYVWDLVDRAAYNTLIRLTNAG